MTAVRPLTLDDIADQRAYEREREGFRRQVIAVKKLRRITVGPVVTLTFESRMTMRFQVQEMARAERMSTDQQIQHELDVYNRLLPAPGELSATLFLELVSEEELRTWLPRLVGIEGACEVRIGTGDATETIVSTPEEEHRSHLTRRETTSAVHYVRFRFDEDQVDAFGHRPVTLAVNHPAYPDGLPGVALNEATRAELATDLAGE
ncbi:MAG TPA: DUF3501 family protein [Acidimicrobiales bacterium]|jgi:hypothetical protein|nr:DUF3501 family protein [Acidimicrobiales bacterium]